MAFFIQEQQPPGFGEQFTAGLGQTLLPSLQQSIQKFTERKEQQRGLKNILSELDQLSPDVSLSEKLRVIAASPEYARLAPQQQTALSSMLQRQAQEQAAKRLSQAETLSPKDILAGVASGEIPSDIGKMLLTPPKTEKLELSPFQKALQAGAAQKYLGAQEDIAKATTALRNIGRIEDIAESTGWVGRSLSSLLGGKTAAELRTLGATAIEPVIKIFNPAGTLPQSKLEWLRKTFSINPSDRASTIKGKVATLKRIAQETQKRSEDLMQLYQQFDGLPPPEALVKFEQENEKILDRMQKNSPIETTQQLPRKQKAPAGQVQIYNKETGESFFIPQERIQEARAEGFEVIR